MKNPTLLFIAVLLFVGSLPGFGQKAPVQIGFKIGGQASNVISHGVNLGLDILQPQAIAGTRAGVYADVPIGKGLYFTPEVSYADKGFKVSESRNLALFEFPIPIGVEAVTRMRYLDAATNLKYKFGNGKVSGFVRGGPYMGYALSGRIDMRINSIIDFKVGSFDINPSSKLYDRTEFGATAGAGMEFQAGPGRLMTEINYSRSFTDFTDLPVVDLGLKNSSFGASIGYSIPIGSAR